MKRLSAIIFLLFSAFLLYGQTQTMHHHLTRLHKIYGVNFVYDSSLDLDKSCSDPDIYTSRSLEEALDILFQDSEINWEIRKRYVVLSGKPSKSGFTILIKEQVDTLEESRIVAEAGDMEKRSSTGFKRLSTLNLNLGSAFLSTPDVIKSIQNLPGVASGTELLSGLFVHGGDGSDNMFLLDGVPLYQSGHLGGIFSSFNSDIVTQVDFYKSGFPARYGGRLSSVIDARTKTGDMYDYHGSISIGLIDGRLQLEGPVRQGKTSFNIALRRSWLDAVTLPVFSMINRKDDGRRQDFKYAFQDFNAGVTHRFSDNNILEFKTYYGKDRLGIGYTEREYDKIMSSVYFNSMNTDVDWGNFLAALIWKKQLSDALQMQSTAYHTRGLSDLETGTSSKGTGDPILASYDEIYRSVTGSTAVKSDFTYKGSSGLLIDFGAIFQVHEFSPERSITNRSWRYKGGVNETTLNEKTSVSGYETAVYADGYLKLSERFSAHTGLRYVLFGIDGIARHRLEPRLSVRYDIGDRSRFDIAYTEMNQFAHQTGTSYLDLPTEIWMPWTKRVDPMLSRQIAAEYSIKLPYGLHIQLGTWYKTMKDLTEQWNSYSYIPPIRNWDKSVILGKGRSYGLETEIEYTGKKLTLAAYHTLTYSERRFDELWYSWYPDRNENRHKLNIMAGYRFSEKIDIYAGWNYHSGNRFTVYGYIYGKEYSSNPHYTYGSPNNFRLPDYHRLDVGANFRKTTQKGNESIWNISIYNAYCRMNAMFASMEIYTGTNKSITYGIVPIIPSFSYTLRF